jgi:uncharacterized phage protein gp47/JayE
MFSARTRVAIRDALLSEWSARHALDGRTLLTSPGSPAFLEAESLALQLEALEAQAVQAVPDILPDTAGEDALLRHGAVEGLDRDPATAAVVTVLITNGPISSSAALTGQTLQSPAGLAYLPVDGSGNPLATLGPTDGGGSVTIQARCTTFGTTGNVAVGTVLTWSSAPTGFASASNTVSDIILGDDIEDIETYRAAIIARRRNRPASGNREDWKEWAEQCAGVEQAWVYPLLSPGGTPNTLGCVTVVCAGAVQGNQVHNTRVIGNTPGAALAAVAGFIEGTNDATGVAVSSGVQLRPATMAAGDYTAQTIDTQTLDVDLTLVNTTANAFPFNATYAMTGSSTTQVVIAGDRSALAGKSILLYLGTTYARGGYVQVLVASAVYNSGLAHTTLTFDAVAHAPANNGAGACVYPAPPNWSAVRDAVFAEFDMLGPGDTSPASRYPGEDVGDRATLYADALIGAARTVPGVLSASTTAVTTTPSAKTTVTLGELLIHQ